MPVSLLSRGSAVLGSLAVCTAALALPMLTVSPAQAAPGDFDPITHSASIDIESFPTTATLALQKFDDVDETYLLQEVRSEEQMSELQLIMSNSYEVY